MAERTSILALIPPPMARDARVRGLLLAFEQALDEMDAADLMLMDPAGVREEALPYLAYEHSLGEFVGPGLPTPVIRTMINGAWDLHEPKGYGAGIISGIAMLGYAATLIQWWEETPPAIRGTHRIEVNVDQPLWPDRPLDGIEAVRAIWRMIHAMQRWSQDHALRIVAVSQVSRPVGVGVLTASRIQIEPWTPASPEIGSTMIAAAAIVIGGRIQIEPWLGIEPLEWGGEPLLFDGEDTYATLIPQGGLQ